MTTETLQSKAERYLLEGRVSVDQVKGNRGQFYVFGSDNDPYAVSYNGDWSCDCPARVLVCAHILACQKITKFDSKHKVSFTKDENDLTKLLSEMLGQDTLPSE